MSQKVSFKTKAAPKQALSARQTVTPAMLIAAIVVAVLILGLIGWRAFGSSVPTKDTATLNARIAAKKAKGQD
jgi:hypothetical protein